MTLCDSGPCYGECSLTLLFYACVYLLHIMCSLIRIRFAYDIVHIFWAGVSGNRSSDGEVLEQSHVLPDYNFTDTSLRWFYLSKEFASLTFASLFSLGLSVWLSRHVRFPTYAFICICPAMTIEKPRILYLTSFKARGRNHCYEISCALIFMRRPLFFIASICSCWLQSERARRTFHGYCNRSSTSTGPHERLVLHEPLHIGMLSKWAIAYRNASKWWSTSPKIHQSNCEPLPSSVREKIISTINSDEIQIETIIPWNIQTG